MSSLSPLVAVLSERRVPVCVFCPAASGGSNEHITGSPGEANSSCTQRLVLTEQIKTFSKNKSYQLINRYEIIYIGTKNPELVETNENIRI